MRPLADVETTLRNELQSGYEAVASLLRHGVQLGGKRLRPAMHLLIARAFGPITPANVVIATVLEMVHTATLVHDDVLDDACERRHLPTINSLWNNHTSILLGDYLFAQSFRLAATLDNTRTCLWVGEAARRVCEGELRQVLGRDDLELDQATYFEMINGKTAELCRVACSLAAAEAGCDDATVSRLAGFGSNLGIAFQIADDYLDLWGDDSTVGKTLGTDLEQGKLTLPVIRVLETSSPEDRQRIGQILQGPADQRFSRLRPWLERSDARTYTAETAERFRRDALASLDVLPDGESKTSLERIAEFSIKRSF
ncbi:polyprenyl synthetase family protein [Roseiconus nitratireducens]|uniref:Polyprenyl synthetase family protein n=1 Tax=Roseiconus nitratireducens TaxID=2605748 RepID=A0A5M6CZN2_9BACT|nr:polyprenyl synthetase family protein [Roseiconus nitratireducens]